MQKKQKKGKIKFPMNTSKTKQEMNILLLNRMDGICFTQEPVHLIYCRNSSITQTDICDIILMTT